MMISHAQEYARLGWRVLPVPGVTPARTCRCGDPQCPKVGKHPLYRLVPSGLTNATNDLAQVNQWWTAEPSANIGVCGGPESGIWILDVDVAGLPAMDSLEAGFGALPYTPTARTGSGGLHYYFKFVEGIGDGKGALPPGIDVKGKGYVVAPPSANANGTYEWLPDLSPDEVEVAEAPRWLVDLILGKKKKVAPTPPTPQRPVASLYAQRALREEEAAVASAPIGEQEQTLNKAAYSLGTLVGAGKLAQDLAYETLVAAGSRMVNAQGRRPWTTRQIQAKVLHGLEDGMAHPREEALPTVSVAPVVPALNGHVEEPTTDELIPMTLADLKAGYQTTRWLVGTPKAGLIPAGGTVVMAGEPGIGKTWMMLDLALSVATGTDWLGHWPCEQGGVLLILEEEDPSTVWDRLTMLAGPRGLSVEQLLELPIRFFISAGIALVDREGNLNRRLEKAITDFAPALVVMDPFRRLHGLEENDSGAMSHLFSLLRALTRVTDPALSIVIIHHLRKATEQLREGLDRLRGSSDIAASVDGAFSVQGVFTQHLVLTHEKSKRGPACGTFRIHPEVGVAGVRLNYVLTVGPPADDSRKEVQEWILAELKIGASSGNRLRTRAKVDGFTEHQIRKELLALEESGDVVQTPGNDGRSKLYVLSGYTAPHLPNADDLE